MSVRYRVTAAPQASGYSEAGASHKRRALRAFFPNSNSPSSDIHDNADTLRQRSRMLYMSAPIATSAINTNRTKVVGTGLTLKATVDRDVLGLSPEAAKEWQTKTEAEFRLWAENRRSCDAMGLNNFYGLQQLTLKSWLMSGDVFAVVKIRNPDKLHPYGLRLHLVEADRVSTPDKFGGLLDGLGYTEGKMVALAHSIANVLEQRLDEINLGQIYTRIDQLPEDLLDILAKDFAVDWYDHDYDLAAKRRTIKSAPYIHRHRGTAGAVLRGIRAIYPGSRLEEWWQYGGEPYHFRVMLDMSGSDASYVSTERVLWAIGYYKSLRSHNDGVYYQSTFGIEIVTSSGYIVYAVRRCGTFPKTATQGGISAGNIIIVTDEFGGSYAHPRTGQLDAGTFPATATQGHTAASEIEVLTVDNGGAYAPEKLAGTYPETATQGFDDAGYVVVQTADGSSTYAAPASGDLTAGLHPATATSGGTSGGGLVAEESGLGVSYIAKVCGSAPGINF